MKGGGIIKDKCLKVFILNWLKKDSSINFDGDEYLVYDI